MRRKRALWADRAVSIVVAGFVGYVFGGWNPPALRTTGLSAAQMVALRFPQDLGDAASAPSVTPVVYAARTATAVAQASLLNPAPMVPHTTSAQPIIKQVAVAQVAVPRTTAADNSAPKAPVQVAAVEPAAPSRIAASAPPHRRRQRRGRMKQSRSLQPFIATSRSGPASFSTMHRSPASKHGCI